MPSTKCLRRGGVADLEAVVEGSVVMEGAEDSHLSVSKGHQDKEEAPSLGSPTPRDMPSKKARARASKAKKKGEAAGPSLPPPPPPPPAHRPHRSKVELEQE
jgi:hypothetical protein